MKVFQSISTVTMFLSLFACAPWVKVFQSISTVIVLLLIFACAPWVKANQTHKITAFIILLMFVPPISLVSGLKSLISAFFIVLNLKDKKDIFPPFFFIL